MQEPRGLPPVEYAHLMLAGRDRARRFSGRLLDHAGAAPRTTPSRVTDPAPGVRLHAYPALASTPDAGPAPAAGPPVLLVPAPIKRAYIWDLEPEVSVVARLRSAGRRVFLAEWTDPRMQDQQWGLEEYADTFLLACVQEVVQQTGARDVALAGHSLGGILAAIFAARRPELVAGLVLLEAPVNFGPDAGALAPFVAAAPHAGWLRPRRGGVPGSFLDVASASASPREFGLERYLDLAGSLADPRRWATHMRVERWMLDEFAMPGQLFQDVVERLYRRDVGVRLQHVGVLVGRSAHRALWPEILHWMTTTIGHER